MKKVITWLSQIFSESEANGESKASYARVAGAFVIWRILVLADKGKEIPDTLQTMFMILVGYQLLSKALNSMSPAVLDYARSKLVSAHDPNPKTIVVNHPPQVPPVQPPPVP